MILWVTTEREPAGAYQEEMCVASLLPPLPPRLPPSSPPTFITKLLIYRLRIQLTFPQRLHYTSHFTRHRTSIELSKGTETQFLQYGKDAKKSSQSPHPASRKGQVSFPSSGRERSPFFPFSLSLFLRVQPQRRRGLGRVLARWQGNK